MSNYYISDLHIGHANVIRHDNRPFRDTEKMKAAFIKRWNDTANANDSVFILGDFAWKNTEGLEVISQLKGKKHLILGNHDSITEEMKLYFEWIKDYAVIRDGETEVVLSHYPIAHWYNQYRGAVHLYGHVHNTKDHDAFLRYADICREMEIPFECYNVGCMMPYMDYTPRTLGEIREKAGNLSLFIVNETTVVQAESFEEAFEKVFKGEVYKIVDKNAPYDITVRCKEEIKYFWVRSG